MKRVIRFLLPNAPATFIQRVRKQVRVFRCLAKAYGQWQTIREWASVDAQGNPVPWYTYPAIEFLSHLELKDFNVIEYGSGNSTLWWAGRAKRVTSVEDDENWYVKIKNKISSDLCSIDYKLEIDPDKYCIMASKKHDIAIVDGSHRRACLEHLYKIDWEGIMLILDNSDWYPKSVQFIQDNFGWVQIDFHGFGPINDYTWTTSIFINPERRKELRYTKALESICGLKQVSYGDY